MFLMEWDGVKKHFKERKRHVCLQIVKYEIVEKEENMTKNPVGAQYRECR